MKRELKPLADQMIRIVRDPSATHLERIEAMRTILAMYGMALPGITPEMLNPGQLDQLRKWQQRVAEKLEQFRQRKAQQNRRAYLRRKIKELEGQDGSGKQQA